MLELFKDCHGCFLVVLATTELMMSCTAFRVKCIHSSSAAFLSLLIISCMSPHIPTRTPITTERGNTCKFSPPSCPASLSVLLKPSWICRVLFLALVRLLESSARCAYEQTTSPVVMVTHHYRC